MSQPKPEEHQSALKQARLERHNHLMETDPVYRDAWNEWTEQHHQRMLTDRTFRDHWHAQHRRRLKSDYTYRERFKLQHHQRMRTNPKYRRYWQQHHQHRLKTDPKYAARLKKRNLEYLRRRFVNPANRQAANERADADARQHAATLAELQGGWHCNVEWPDEGICGAKLNPDEEWHVDHKIPASRPDVYEALTGTRNVHEIANLQLSCTTCNLKKLNKLLPAYGPGGNGELIWNYEALHWEYDMTNHPPPSTKQEQLTLTL